MPFKAKAKPEDAEQAERTENEQVAIQNRD
jgi:hypothetical protein